MAPYKLNKLPHNDYAFRVIVILGVLLTGCGGSSGQSTQPTQALGATSNTSSSSTTSNSTTASNNNCSAFSGSNSFGQSIVNTQSCTLDHADTEREYFIHVPDVDADSTPLPVVLSFHGYTSTAETNLSYTGLQSFAESEKFIAVYPQGTILASKIMVRRRCIEINGGETVGPKGPPINIKKGF